LSLRWGILSTANITEKLLGSGHDQQFVAVGSRDLGRAQAFATEHGITRAHGSYEELLADPEVDAIYNPLPNSLHVEWSIKALEAGKHVLCEKPMSRHPEEVERAFDVAEREGRVLEEAFMWRHHPQVAHRMCSWTGTDPVTEQLLKKFDLSAMRTGWNDKACFREHPSRPCIDYPPQPWRKTAESDRLQ
jgi:hypothetical protein